MVCHIGQGTCGRSQHSEISGRSTFMIFVATTRQRPSYVPSRINVSSKPRWLAKPAHHRYLTSRKSHACPITRDSLWYNYPPLQACSERYLISLARDSREHTRLTEQLVGWCRMLGNEKSMPTEQVNHIHHNANLWSLALGIVRRQEVQGFTRCS